jgi:hypothetical protein
LSFPKTQEQERARQGAPSESTLRRPADLPHHWSRLDLSGLRREEESWRTWISSRVLHIRHQAGCKLTPWSPSHPPSILLSKEAPTNARTPQVSTYRLNSVGSNRNHPALPKRQPLVLSQTKIPRCWSYQTWTPPSTATAPTTSRGRRCGNSHALQHTSPFYFSRSQVLRWRCYSYRARFRWEFSVWMRCTTC